MARLIESLQREGGFHHTVISPAEGPLRPRLEAAGAVVELLPAIPLGDFAGYRLADRPLRPGLEAAAAVVQLLPAIPLDVFAGYERAIRPLGAWLGRHFDLVIG